MPRQARMTTEEMAEEVLKLVRGEETVEAAAERLQLSVDTLQTWLATYLAAGRMALGLFAQPPSRRQQATLTRALAKRSIEAMRILAQLQPEVAALMLLPRGAAETAESLPAAARSGTSRGT